MTLLDILILWFIVSIPASLLIGRLLRWTETGN